MRRVVADIETNGFRDIGTKFWVLCATDIDTGEEFTFLRPDLDPTPLLEFSKEVELWIGHKFLTFDAPEITRLTNGAVQFDYENQILDTLVLSRLVYYAIPGGHSLDAWGERLNFGKIKFVDFHAYSEEMLTYCKKDVALNIKVFRYLERFYTDDKWKDSIELEHFKDMMCEELHRDGFPFDIEKAKELYQEVTIRLEELDERVQASFPPAPVFTRTYTPKTNKDGSLRKNSLGPMGEDGQVEESGTYSAVKFVPFNPGSPKQVVTQLNKCGWKPFEKTKGHEKALRDRRFKKKGSKEDKLPYYEEFGWKISEDNLATLPDDAPDGALALRDWLVTKGRQTRLEEWLECYNPSTGCIHGSYMAIGAWTHRCSHSKPNMANIISEYDGRGNIQYLGKEFRSLFRVSQVESDECWLVGTDADGIQLRILAHLLENDEYIEAIESGDKDLGTDIHNLNRRALGSDICQSRDAAKTFIYAFLLGAGVDRVMSILHCQRKEATTAIAQFIEGIDGLSDLKKVRIPKEAKQGYMVALDGRKVVCDSEHLMLAGHLQCNESIIMARAAKLWIKWARDEGINFIIRNYVHDEWQVEVRGTLKVAERFGELQRLALEQTGRELNMLIPIRGSTNIGKNWYDTH